MATVPIMSPILETLRAICPEYGFCGRTESYAETTIVNENGIPHDIFSRIDLVVYARQKDDE
jgi:hypothetical protein